jgi:hypothetical protein
MPRHDWIWLEEAFEERAAILHRTGAFRKPPVS